MRIGIDARRLLKLRTGVERMTYHFVDNLSKMDDGHEFLLLLDEHPQEHFPSSWPARVIVEPRRHAHLQRLFDAWILLQLPKVLRRENIDVLYSPCTKFPISGPPSVVTVHGLEWHRCPADYRVIERIKQWTWFWLSSRRSAGMVTFATSTKRDIMALRPRCSLPICMAPEGVDPIFRCLDASLIDVETARRFGIGGPFVLSVCSLEPRKNVDRLIRSYASVVAAHNIAHSLVLVGRQGWKSSRLHKLCQEHQVLDRVLFPGYVSDADLVQLYNQASLFAYPSKYEGFGLPVLEAMACGTPVVTSNGSSLSEVAGDAAILVDPHSDEDVARGLTEGLLDEPRRQWLVESGLRRAAEFSWEEMTRQICRFIVDNVR